MSLLFEKIHVILEWSPSQEIKKEFDLYVKEFEYKINGIGNTMIA